MTTLADPAASVAAPGARVSARDLLALMKPRITLMVVITFMGGYYLAPGQPPTPRALWALLGTVLIVSGANALNMYIERVTDGLMHRTRKRPLPSGRLQPEVALWFGVALALASLPILALGANLLTAGLGLFALLSYVLAYTPMKRRSPTSLLIGSVPGAIPPLMGWTAARGAIETPGLMLFAVMFVWQVPHFLAIALYSAEDYARGGIKVLPLVEGERVAKRQIVAFTGALIPVSLGLVPLHIAGPWFSGTAMLGGLLFLGMAMRGLWPGADRAWARRLFLVSLLYLTALFVVLGVEGRHLARSVH